MTAPGRQGHGEAPAKLILSGEHSVVYGHLAVAVAVDRYTRVRVSAGEPDSPTLIRCPPFPIDTRLRAAVCAVVPARGLVVDIEGDIPIGRGMGSSASLAVALVRAWADFQGETATFSRCHCEGFAVERVFHGTPSGVDHAVIARGGAVAYRKQADGPQIAPLPCPSDLPMVVLDSGTAGNTAELVAGVRSRRPGIDPVLAELGRLTDRFARALRTGAPPTELGATMTENHRLLSDIGVSTPRLDQLVDLALSQGAHGAKLAGAGGGGVVLALMDQPETLLQAASRAGIDAFAVRPVPAHPVEVSHAP